MGEEIKATLDEKEIADKVDDATPTDESLKTEQPTKEEVDKKIPYDRFKVKVDEANALKEKLAEYERTQAEKERKELEEREEYKTLYEQAVQQGEEAKQEAIAVEKRALPTNAGYSEEQVRLLAKLVEGEDDESRTQSIKLLQATIPAQDSYADPSPLNGKKDKPETVGPEEHAKSIYERIKNKIR